jgi:hypothetical protein
MQIAAIAALGIVVLVIVAALVRMVASSRDPRRASRGVRIADIVVFALVVAADRIRGGEQRGQERR